MWEEVVPCRRVSFSEAVSHLRRLIVLCSLLMAILSARWQRDDRPEYVSGRTRICNHRHRRRGGTRSSLTTPSQVQLRPEGGEQLRLSGLAAMRHSCITHGGTGYQHPRPPSHRGLDLDKKAVLGQLGHREYWFAERASEHVGSVEEWEDYVGGWLSFKFCRQVGHLMSILHFLHELLHIEEQNAYFPQFWPLIRSN